MSLTMGYHGPSADLLHPNHDRSFLKVLTRNSVILTHHAKTEVMNSFRMCQKVEIFGFDGL